VKIILADDHALIRRGMRTELAALDAELTIVEAVDALTLRHALEANMDADLALIDVYMPGMQGARSIADLHEAFPTVPLVALSGEEHLATVQAMLRAGAAGFIPKSGKPEVMLQAIRLVLAGGQYLPPLLLREATMTGQADDPDCWCLALTPRQREIVSLLALGLSNKEIVKQLNLSEGTIKSHIATIFRILGVHNRTAAVTSARKLLREAD
jgi:DNA-binding NarL/FixJ family response regulator